jgi:hypothetical protein
MRETKSENLTIAQLIKEKMTDPVIIAELITSSEQL